MGTTSNTEMKHIINMAKNEASNMNAINTVEVRVYLPIIEAQT
jgi:hypothetical protein